MTELLQTLDLPVQDTRKYSDVKMLVDNKNTYFHATDVWHPQGGQYDRKTTTLLHR